MLEWVYSSKKITAQKNLGQYLSPEWVLQGKNYRSQKIKGAGNNAVRVYKIRMTS